MPVERFTYSFRTAVIGGATKYFAAFTDGEGNRQETEIPREVFMALDDCRKHEQRESRSDVRHIEQSLQAEAQLVERAVAPSMPLDEAVSLSLDLRAALPLLTDTQRRRFLLHDEHGLNNEQIAAIEGCSVQAVSKSIVMAKEQLKKYISAEG